jgi:hypothetical protein
MTSSVSFFAQDQAAWAASAAFNQQLFDNSATAAKLFTTGSSASLAPSVLSTQDPNAIINGFGQAYLNSSMNQAILAAQEANDLVKKQTAAQQGNGSPPPAGDLSSQVTFAGSLGVDFGTAGQAMGGGYHFVSGAALQTQFKAAFGAKTSNGEFIDTVSVVGNTMTGSTSGPNAHDVFNLTLDPQTGMYTFQLVGPIDQKTTKGSYNSVFLGGLFQAVSSTGQKMSIPTVEMDVYNDYGSVSSQGNWALLHEGALTWVDPSTVTLSNSTDVTNATSGSTGSSSSTSSSTATAYKPPTDPRTGYAYTTSTAAALGVINSVNIFS